MSDEIAARLRALLPEASNIDRMLISVTDLRALLDERDRMIEHHAKQAQDIMTLSDELARWRDLTEAVRVMKGYPEGWPEHGNAPLAIAAGYQLALAELARLREERKGACPVCGCEEVDNRNLWTCRCPAPRAPVEGEAGEMVQWLSALNHISREDCFLQSPMFAKAADLITRQAASLRETVEVIERIASQNLYAEITDTDPDELDWLYAYEQCVKEARAWLAKQGGDSGGY